MSQALLTMVDMTTERTPETTFIYALCDPDGTVRYVGKANNPARRLLIHTEPNQLRPDNYRTRWLRGLVAEGLRPTMRILEEVAWADWEDAERRWIGLYRQNGCLTNGTDGGDQGPGSVKGSRSAPARARQAAAMRRHWQDPDFQARHAAGLAAAFTPEVRARVSAAAKKRANTTASRARATETFRKARPATTRRGSQLSDSEIVAVRTLAAEGAPLPALVARFRSSLGVIHRLVSGQTRPEAGGPVRPAQPHLTAEQVTAIRARLAAGGLQRSIAEDYGVTQSQISNIARHRSHALAT